MIKGQVDADVIRRHLAALRAALAHLRRHAGHTAADLRANADLRWTVERGLQLCVQNALDIATHLAATSGLDSPDYATAIGHLSSPSSPALARAFRKNWQHVFFTIEWLRCRITSGQCGSDHDPALTA